MDAEFGFMPLPGEGGYLFALYEKCEECSVTKCMVDALDPHAAEEMSRGSCWPWCPGYCVEYAWKSREALGS